jgi:DNA-binding NarL/FixJ family response regulator
VTKKGADPLWVNHLFFSRVVSAANNQLAAFGRRHREHILDLLIAPRHPLDLLDSVKDSTPHKFIGVQNVHHLARQSGAPERYYRELVEVCNYLAATRETPVLLTDMGLPTPFLKENLALDLWNLVDCNPNPLTTFRGPFEPRSDWQRAMLSSAATRRTLTAAAFGSTAECALLFSEIGECEALLGAPPYLSLAGEIAPASGGDEPDFARLQSTLREKIVGQDEAIRRFAEAAEVAFSPIVRDERPKAVFLLVGTSGIGKTEMCRQLAGFLPGYKFLQINLAEQSAKEAVDKLIGLGRGFEDSEQGGVLTEPIRRHPRHVVLFDELDHADVSVIRLLYKILEGEITDGRGRPVSFRECFIAMTTNTGVTGHAAAPRHLVEEALRSTPRGLELFSPAFLGRVSSIIECRSLAPYDYVEIARRYFTSRIIQPYAHHRITVTFEVTAPPALVEQGCFTAEALCCELLAMAAGMTPAQGARPLLQVVDEHLVRPIELCRLASPEPLTEVTIRVTPYLPDLDGLSYDHARILLIDDDPEARQAVASNLARLPVNVDQCGFNKQQVLRLLSKQPRRLAVSLVLLDLMDRDDIDRGRAFYLELKDRLDQYPVCLLSHLPAGPHRHAVIARLQATGLAGYLSKSADESTTMATIAKMLRQRYFDAKVHAAGRKGKRKKRANLRTMLPAQYASHLRLAVNLELV